MYLFVAINCVSIVYFSYYSYYASKRDLDERHTVNEVPQNLGNYATLANPDVAELVHDPLRRFLHFHAVLGEN